MKRILPALFALVCAASASAAPFQNGSFEFGTLTGDPCNVSLPAASTAITGWTVISGNIDYVTPACWPSSEGTRSLDLVGTGSIGGIEQTFDTVPGQAYEVIFDLAGNPSALFPPTVKNLTVTINGTPHSYTYNTLDHTPATIGWTAHSFTFVATGSSSTISFVSNMAGSTFAGAALDNVRVLAIPAGAWTGSGGNVYSGSTPFPAASPVICSGPGTNWSFSGTTFSYPTFFTGFGVQGPVVASYDVPFGNAADGICGSWTTTNTATSTGTVSVAWQYTGNHSSFNTTADLQAFVNGSAVTLVHANSPPGNPFLYSGQHTFNVNNGDTYGFTMTGSNFDYIDALHGTLYLTGTGASSLGLQSSANPTVVGSPVTFTATVTGTTAPSGTVAFSDGATLIAGCDAVQLVPLNATQSTAVCNVPSLSLGGHGINVLYSGDMANLRSGNMLSQTINAPIVVDSTVDSVDASPGNGICADSIGRCTLRAAIMEANALAGAQAITLPAGTYTLTIAGAGEDGGVTGDLDISGDVTIVGADAASTIVDGGGLDRVFQVNSGIVTIADLTVRNGFTPGGQAGGGIENFGSLTLDQVVVSGNTTDADGGGIFNQGTLVLDSSTVSGNVGGGGAGIYSFSSTLTLTNSTVSGNHSVAVSQCGFGGGGMLIFNGSATITSSTIFANFAECNPGFGGRGDAIASNGAAVTIQNSVLASPATGGLACFGTVTSLGRNIVDDATCNPVASDLINTDPLLGPLADNGGATPTHSPLFGSPAVDAVPNPSCIVALDQRGIARPQGAACDIGAVEGSLSAPVIATPVLIRALPTGSAIEPLLIGRVDGLPTNSPITVQLFSGTSCTNGVLGGSVAQIGSDGSVNTDPLDPAGYFGAPLSGSQGQFVAIRLSSPQITPLSTCVVTAADNDTWPKALGLTGASVTVPDWIDAAGKARWYRFSVLPGQSIQVTMSGLPADYELAVFKDIASEFEKELVPATTDQLTKLSAQYAPSAFSPSAFSPSAFSPSAFSPSAFSPSAFSPSAFSPSAFSPSAFSPSAFSPSAFSPSAFSPSAFSPSAFSPSAFSPSAFSPSAFSPSAFSDDELVHAFSSAQTRSIIAASMTPGTAAESVVVNTWNNTGNFYVRVTGRAGAFSTTPYTLAVTKQGTSCAAVANTAISTRTPYANSGYNTIVLLDSSKTSLSQALPGGGTLGSKLAAFVQRTDVKGLIVDVADVAMYGPRVGQLKTQASNNVGCPFAKNLVAFEIKSIVDAYLSNPLKYVAIVGNDDAIPFFRYPDQTLLGQESGYVPPVSSNSASEASLRGNFVLSQDTYGAATHISLGVSEFPIPGLAVGRLIETPAEIAGMIDAYVAANGSVSPTSSLVTGYDFLQDAADAVRAELQLGTGHSPDILITPNSVSPADTRTYANGGPWTANDLRAKLFATRHDVMFLGGHFNANSALAADFKSSLVTSELTASTVNLANAVVFSAGCHAGYNLVDTDAINGVTFPLDWAQAFAQKKTTLVAGTGYQYGDTEFLEYSERLYLNLAKELRAGAAGTPVAVGEALVRAKRAYLATTPDVRGLHAKAVLEATVFGLPMLGVDMPAGRTGISTNSGVINAQPSALPNLAAMALGLRLADLSVSPTLTSNTLNLTNYEQPLPNTITATWLSGANGVVTNPAEPALPLQVVNVTPVNSDHVLRGVGFRGATYSDSTVLPLTGAPTTELRGVHTPFSSPVFFPMRLWTSNYFSALSGGGTNLLVTPAQHRALDASNSTLRQYSGLALRLFYSDLTAVSDDNAPAFLSDAPTIVHVDAVPSGAVTTFSAQVVGDPAAAINEVWVTYTSGAGASGTWTSLDLQQCVTPLPTGCGTTSDSQYWKAQIATAALPADTKYIAQAASGTGLVSLDDNLGRYYSYSSVAAAPVATTIAFSPPVPTSAAFGANLSITAVLSAGAGKVVTIAAGGAARTGTTNGTGSVTVQLPMLSPPGSYALIASFGGDSAFLPSAVSAPPVTVTKAAATLATPPAGVGAVLTGGTQPLINESVQFLISGPQGVQQVFAITDYTGRATVPPPGSPSGTYTVLQACFGGNATYTAAKLNANPACGYTFGGFLQPVDSLPTVNSVKAGSAVPVKFGLGGNYGLAIFDVGSPKSQAIACGTAVVDDVEETVTAGGSALSYDSASGRYNYVWKTDKAWAGTCRQLILNFNDGSIQRASFKFK